MINDDYIKTSEAVKFIGLIGSLALALSGQSDLLPKPYDKVLTIIGISATTVFSFLMHPPRNSTALERRTDYLENFTKREEFVKAIPTLDTRVGNNL